MQTPISKVSKKVKEGMATGDAETEVDETGDTKVLDVEEKGKTFRKRRLSLTTLRQLDNDSGDDDADDRDNVDIFPNTPLIQDQSGESLVSVTENNDKAHTFRKRRLSLTSNNSEATEEHDSPTNCKRRRKASDAPASSSHSTATGIANNRDRNIQSKILHAAEILSPSPSNSSFLPKLYQQSAPPQQLPLADESGEKAPKWKERHIRPHADDDKSLPFPRNVVGTFSCHGVEPIYDDNDYYLPLGAENEENSSAQTKLTMAAKINQDRGGVAFPYGNSTRTALFAVYDGTHQGFQRNGISDAFRTGTPVNSQLFSVANTRTGHGQGGELVSQYSLNEIQRLLEKHPDFNKNIESAFKDTFLRVNSSLKEEQLIEPMYAGTTACVALLRDKQLVLSNAGDSRSVLARKIGGACCSRM